MKDNQLIEKLKSYNFKTIKLINELYLLVGLIDEISKLNLQGDVVDDMRSAKISFHRKNILKENYIPKTVAALVDYALNMRASDIVVNKAFWKEMFKTTNLANYIESQYKMSTGAIMDTDE